MTKWTLGCFAAGGVAGYFAFLGGPGKAVSEAFFLLFMLTGMVLAAWGRPRRPRKAMVNRRAGLRLREGRGETGRGARF